jgi:hypothetical protein
MQRRYSSKQARCSRALSYWSQPKFVHIGHLLWENAARVTKAAAKITMIKGRIAAIEYRPTLMRIIYETPTKDPEASVVGEARSAKSTGELEPISRIPLSSPLDGSYFYLRQLLMQACAPLRQLSLDSHNNTTPHLKSLKH